MLKNGLFRASRTPILAYGSEAIKLLAGVRYVVGSKCQRTIYALKWTSEPSPVLGRGSEPPMRYIDPTTGGCFAMGILAMASCCQQ